MYRPLICLVALVTLEDRASAQVAYTKGNAVYVLPCDKTGQPPKGAKPIKICDLWPDQEEYVYRSIYRGYLAMAGFSSASGSRRVKSPRRLQK